MGFRIEELDIKNIGMFYDGISASFVPGYELESKTDFENIVCDELKANPRAFFQILNDKSKLIGGFRLLDRGLSYFFLEGDYPKISNALTKVILLMSGYNLKRIYTKQRYAPILLKHNFSILYERYIMVLNLKRTFSAVDLKNIELFSDAYLDESISLLYNSYDDPVNKLIFGEPNKSRFKKELEDLLADKNNLEFLSDNSFVLLIDNKVVGIVIVGKYLKKPMIFELVVKKQFQGRGIGKQLLIKSISTLQDKYTELLLMVTKGNEKAEILYKSTGFKKIAENLVVLEKGG